MSVELGFWGEAVLNNLAAWLVTYLLYSTVVLGLVALTARRRLVSLETESALWRLALVLGPIAATARIAVEHLGETTVVSGPEALAVAGAAGSVLVGLAGLSVVVGTVLSGRLGRVAVRERARLSDRVPVKEGEEWRLLREVAEAADVPVPLLTASDSLAGPVAIGRREICIPTGGFTDLAPEIRRAMLAHEVGHLVRGDGMWMAAAHLLERLFFFQPLHRLARRRLREGGEFLADAFAVRLVGGPEPLVAGLVALARSFPAPSLAASAFAPGSLLLRRVERALGAGSSGGRPSSILLGAFAWGLAALVWLTPAAVPAYDCRVTGALPDVASWILLHL